MLATPMTDIVLLSVFAARVIGNRAAGRLGRTGYRTARVSVDEGRHATLCALDTVPHEIAVLAGKALRLMHM